MTLEISDVLPDFNRDMIASFFYIEHEGDAVSMDKIFEIGILYDFYGELLTAHQKHIAQLYFENDYSLAEIAEETGKSRQAVHDVVSRTEKILRSYEEKLGLAAKFHRREQEIESVRQSLEKLSRLYDENPELKERLKDIEDAVQRLED